MPELPEVETVRKALSSRYIGKIITNIEILYPKMIHTNLNQFVETLKDQTITSIGRKGKYLFINFSNEFSIISHLSMERKFILREKEEHI